MPNWLGYDPTTWLLIGALLAPLVGFVALVFFGRRMGKAAGWFGTAAIATAAVLALYAASLWAGREGHGPVKSLLIPWLTLSPRLVLSVGVHVDGLTIAMCAMVTVVATMIHLFSIGYMAEDSRYSRFFAYMNLFCFSMLGLVLGNTLLSLFVFWELVGLCSYLLIGFWFERKSASDAAIKAFVVNRIGDFGFLLGLAGAFFWLGSADGTIAGMNEAGRTIIQDAVRTGQSPPTWLTVVGLLLFCGAIGKSAQFPLHVWLPDAMEGPTPVSALIHAATMVAAGVYMVGRIFGLLTGDALLVIALIGLITLTMAALIAVTQMDIKRVLAYSTVSQLGYMVMAIGLGGYVAGLFHLITHAFFKALLFLGSGAVIHACHHEQDIRKMGGLWKAIPVTCATFLIATLAIAGVPFTSGFFSKDMILGNAYDYAHGTAGAVTAGAGAPWAGVFFYLPLAMAYVTSFYMFRVWWLTFFTSPRDEHVYHHAEHHGVPWTMNLPLVVLAVGALVAGYHWMPFEDWIDSTRAHGAWERLSEAAHHAVALPAMLASVVGFGLAYLVYRKGFDVAEKVRRRIEPLYQLVHHKFYFDELYNALVVRTTMGLCYLSAFWDQYVVDGLVNLSGWATQKLALLSGWFDNRGIDGAANGLAAATLSVGKAVRAPQTGRIRNYVLFMVTGVLVAAGVFLVIRVL
jgi:NADH-quinone oxidoreductase subunit L